MQNTVDPPDLEFLAHVDVTVARPVEVGETEEGVRRIIPITGGRVSGPELNGSVLNAGADFQLLRSATVTELVAKYVIETDDGERLYVDNFGLRTGSSEDIAKITRGNSVDPSRIYFRCVPRIQATGPRWSWLSSRILLATGKRLPDAVRLSFFVVV